MLASLETRWLHAPKWLRDPAIILVNANSTYDGAYLRPYNGEILIDDKYVDCTNGIIAISETTDAASVAHEFRHHWQAACGKDMTVIHTWVACSYANYKSQITRYIRDSRIEMDALLYEVAKYPNDSNQQRLEWVREL